MLCVVLLGAGCSTDYSALNKYVPKIITPYRMDIQQGNFVTQDMVEKLQAGQTRDQVKFILGTPLLTDVFHADRWDYLFRFSKGWNDPEKHLLTVYFQDDKLDHWAANVPPPKANTLAVPEKPGFFKRMFTFGKSTEPAAAPAPASQPAAGTAPPAPAEPQVGGAANLSVAASEPPKAGEPPPPASEPPKTTEPPPPATAATPSNIIAPQPAEPPPQKSPGLMGRLFGWMKSSGGAAEGVAATNRAANPDPEPQPTLRTAPPPPPEPAEPAPAPANARNPADGKPGCAVSPPTDPRRRRQPCPSRLPRRLPPAAARTRAEGHRGFAFAPTFHPRHGSRQAVIAAIAGTPPCATPAAPASEVPARRACACASALLPESAYARRPILDADRSVARRLGKAKDDGALPGRLCA